MPKASNQSKVSPRPDADELFRRASEQWDRGKLRSAFRLFLSGAKAGDAGAEHNLGYFYDTGTGVQRSRQRAIYWYKRAFRHGYGAAASNIGTIFRDEGNLHKALSWFERAMKLGDGDANLEIAKIHLERKGDVGKALPYLTRAIRAGSNDITAASREEARRLMGRLKSRSATGGSVSHVKAKSLSKPRGSKQGK